MSEVSHAREDHRDIVLVRCRDDLLIAHGAAGLDDSHDAPLRSFVEAVAKREERVGGEDRAGERKVRLFGTDAGRIDAAHLPGADTDELSVARVDDSIRFDVLDDGPRKAKASHLLLARRTLCDDAERIVADATSVALLHEDAARDATQLEHGTSNGNRRHAHDPKV